MLIKYLISDGAEINTQDLNWDTAFIFGINRYHVLAGYVTIDSIYKKSLTNASFQ